MDHTRSGFVTTRWSQVLMVADASDTRAHDAMSYLCHAYWRPLLWLEEVGKAGGQSQAGTSEFVEIREVVARYDCLLHGGELVRVDGKPAMKISNDNATALQIQLLKIQKPPFTRKRYAIIGEIKYEDVHGNGYLEMWNYFRPSKPGMPEGAYFSRTLGDSGESGKLSGTSNWRRFKLPFDSTGTKESLDRLELNLILPAQGTVYIRAVELIE